MSWRGIFPSIPTPFTPDGEVDFAAQREIVRFAINCGCHGLMCFGLAGETFRLTTEERKRLCDVILEEADGAIPVLVGVAAESEYVARELAHYAERAGADGVVLPPPVSGTITPDLLEQFLLRVADAVTVPVMVQDAKEYLGVGVGPAVVRSVAAAAPHVAYVKLETGPDGLAFWRRELPETIGILGGNAGLYILDCVRAGAAGIAPGLEVADVLVRIFESETAGDAARAEQLFRDILPLLVFELQDHLDHFNLCAKHVLSRRGVKLHGGLRQPALSLPSGAVELLDAYLEALALGSLKSATLDG
jgi:dihydrodipicolinate synthase/N-acetylneuraminate lyase